MAHVFNTSIFLHMMDETLYGRLYVEHRTNICTHTDTDTHTRTLFRILKGIPSRLCACVCLYFWYYFRNQRFFPFFPDIPQPFFTNNSFACSTLTQFGETDERLHRWKWLSVKREEEKSAYKFIFPSFSHQATTATAAAAAAAATTDGTTVCCVLNRF